MMTPVNSMCNVIPALLFPIHFMNESHVTPFGNPNLPSFAERSSILITPPSSTQLQFIKL